MPPIHFLIEHIAHHILTVCPWNLKARNPCSQCDQSNLVHEHMSQVHSIAHHSRSSHAMNRQTITQKTPQFIRQHSPLPFNIGFTYNRCFPSRSLCSHDYNTIDASISSTAYSSGYAANTMSSASNTGSQQSGHDPSCSL